VKELVNILHELWILTNHIIDVFRIIEKYERFYKEESQPIIRLAKKSMPKTSAPFTAYQEIHP
jgi:hypothetical protein